MVLNNAFTIDTTFSRLLTYRWEKGKFLKPNVLSSVAYPWHFWCGSGSVYPCLWLVDPDPSIFITDLQDVNKKLIKNYFYFLKVHSHNFSKMKSQKKSQNSTYKSRFFLLFLLNDRRIRIRIQTSDEWIRIRIRNTGSYRRNFHLSSHRLPGKVAFLWGEMSDILVNDVVHRHLKTSTIGCSDIYIFVTFSGLQPILDTLRVQGFE